MAASLTPMSDCWQHARSKPEHQALFPSPCFITYTARGGRCSLAAPLSQGPHPITTNAKVAIAQGDRLLSRHHELVLRPVVHLHHPTTRRLTTS